MTQLNMESMVDRSDGLIHVTQSDVSSFKNCRRQWFLGSYLGLRARHAPIMGPMHLGTRVHAALEQYYGYSRDLLVAYKQIADDEYDKLCLSGVVFDESAWNKEVDLGRIMLEGYLEYLAETGADQDFEVIGAEQVLEHVIDVDGIPVVLRGKIDCRIKNKWTDQNLVIDWKTTNSFEKLTSVAHLSEQLLTYMTLENLVHKNDPDHKLQGAMLVMLRRVARGSTSKPPYYDRIEVHHSKERLRSFYKQLYGTLIDYVRVVHALDAGTDHRIVAYPNPSSTTRWSPYRHIMEMMDDGSRIEDMISDLFIQIDPHARYKSEKAGLFNDIE